MTPGWRRLPRAVVTDVPVLGAMVLAWLTVAVFWAHLAAGLLPVAFIAVHLQTRRRMPWRGGSSRRRLAYGVFLVAAMGMAASGLLRWVGVPPQYVWHGGISYAVLGLAVVHVWSVRHRFRARFRALPERNTT